MKKIVVGIDGSPGSAKALEFALGEARLRDAEVEAVHVWHVPAAVYGGGGLAPAVIESDELEDGARARLDEIVDGVDTDGVDVERVVREGQPAEVLVEEAERADLLVVGSRGLGELRSLVLGSVSHECCHRARCPVVVVPHER